MKLGISGQALGGVMDFLSIVWMGAKYGISDFEIWPVNAVGHGAGYRNRDVQEIARIAQGEGVSIGCVTMGDAFDEGAVADRENYVAALCSALEAAKALGAPTVNHYCYHISRDEPDFARMEAYWAEPLKLARELGVTLSLENEAHDATRTPERMLQVLEHFNDPCFRTNFDATNYFHASAEGYPAAYDILKDHIGYVHLKNACLHREGMPAGNTGAPMSGYHAPRPIQYAPIPDGALNIAGLISRLIEDGQYRGLCTLEPHTKPEFVEDFYRRESAYLKGLGFFQS